MERAHLQHRAQGRRGAAAAQRAAAVRPQRRRPAADDPAGAAGWCRCAPRPRPRSPPVLVDRDGVDPAMAAFAARAAQGHVGRARRPATDETARQERREVLMLPRSLGTSGALTPPRTSSTPPRRRPSGDRRRATPPEGLAGDRARRRCATGRGVTGGRGSAGADQGAREAAEEPGHPDQSRRPRPRAGRPRGVLPRRPRRPARHRRRLSTPTPVSRWPPRPGHDARRRPWPGIDAVLACREAVDANVAPLLAVEALALALQDRLTAPDRPAASPTLVPAPRRLSSTGRAPHS